MAGIPNVPLWLRMVGWVTKQSAVRKDAGLKRFETELSWTDMTKSVKIGFDDVIAESDAQARQLSNAEATKLAPAIKSAFEEREIVPPYMKDPKGALALWNVKACALQRRIASETSKVRWGRLRHPISDRLCRPKKPFSGARGWAVYSVPVAPNSRGGVLSFAAAVPRSVERRFSTSLRLKPP